MIIDASTWPSAMRLWASCWRQPRARCRCSTACLALGQAAALLEMLMSRVDEAAACDGFAVGLRVSERWSPPRLRERSSLGFCFDFKACSSSCSSSCRRKPQLQTASGKAGAEGRGRGSSQDDAPLDSRLRVARWRCRILVQLAKASILSTLPLFVICGLTTTRALFRLARRRRTLRLRPAMLDVLFLSTSKWRFSLESRRMGPCGELRKRPTWCSRGTQSRSSML